MHDHHDHSHHDHHHHDHSHSHSHPQSFEKKTQWVLMIATATMLLEIAGGWITKSMALIAEGWHMGTHVFALGLTFLAYRLTRKYIGSLTVSFNQEKLLSLAGFSNAIVLQIIALTVLYESVERIINPITIQFNEAIFVAIIGLIVNSISAKILHHDHDHSDFNIRAAYLHVLADIFTSLTALGALLAAKYFHIFWADSISGIVSSVVISSWAFTLIRASGRQLVEWKNLTSK